jgi:hypothetical protein
MDERFNAPRHQPCDLLTAKRIPYTIWFEDALQIHGVPTHTFSLHLLIRDPQREAAVNCLLEHGWNTLPNSEQNAGSMETHLLQRRLIPSGFQRTSVKVSYVPPAKRPSTPPPPLELKSAEVTETVLLRACDWNFTISEETVYTSHAKVGKSLVFPKLQGFLMH